MMKYVWENISLGQTINQVFFVETAIYHLELSIYSKLQMKSVEP